VGICIVGQTRGRERDAAEQLKKRLEAAFRPEDTVIIVAGAKCYGEPRQDIDLLVFGLAASGFRIKQSLLPREIADYPVYLSSFALVVEVKDHSGDSVRFVAGNQVDVRYNGRWSSATHQVHQQVHSVRNFLKRQIGKAPWISQALWLRNVAGDDLRPEMSDILGAACTADDVFRILVQQSAERLARRAATSPPYLSLSACKQQDAPEIRAALDFFRREIEPGNLDRRKLEIVSQRILRSQHYGERLGSQLLLFRGRAGAGKTLRLLQIARTLHEERGARVLFLTYNLALVADVRRLLSELGVRDKVDERTIHIRSSTGYFFDLLKLWGLEPDRQAARGFPHDAYRQRKRELLASLRGMTSAAIAARLVAADSPELFAWDFVLVDEAQDWPEDERDLLFAVFGPDRLIVADGVDQFVRGHKRCDWTSGVGTGKRQIVTLRRSLRLKANLCRLAAAFAADAGLDWDMEPNDEVAGGRVRLVLGRYSRDVHERIMKAHAATGNRPIDALFCLTGAANAPSSDFPGMLRSWGGNVWDGTTTEGRQSYPQDASEHRVVKYESCRGLEGWTVVCLDLDRFFDRQFSEGLKTDRDLLQTPEEVATRFAARWCLIPFTRAIDTLVVQLDPRSRLAERLLPLARAHKDFVELELAPQAIDPTGPVERLQAGRPTRRVGARL
jgi:hypothetical protein